MCRSARAGVKDGATLRPCDPKGSHGATHHIRVGPLSTSLFGCADRLLVVAGRGTTSGSGTKSPSFRFSMRAQPSPLAVRASRSGAMAPRGTSSAQSPSAEKCAHDRIVHDTFQLLQGACIVKVPGSFFHRGHGRTFQESSYCEHSTLEAMG